MYLQVERFSHVDMGMLGARICSFISISARVLQGFCVRVYHG